MRIHATIVSKVTGQSFTETYNIKDILEFNGVDDLVSSMVSSIDCDCEPIGESNVVECNCEEDWNDYKLTFEGDTEV